MKRFNLKDKTGNQVTYYSNRIKVRNIGRSAAKEFKAFLIIDNDIERIAWIIPNKSNGFTITLNAFDTEYMDACAVKEDGSKLIAPTERGFGETENDARDLIATKATIRVSAANAKKAESDIDIMSIPSLYPDSGKSVVRFVDDQSYRNLSFKLDKEERNEGLGIILYSESCRYYSIRK